MRMECGGNAEQLSVTYCSVFDCRFSTLNGAKDEAEMVEMDFKLFGMDFKLFAVDATLRIIEISQFDAVLKFWSELTFK